MRTGHWNQNKNSHMNHMYGGLHNTVLNNTSKTFWKAILTVKYMFYSNIYKYMYTSLLFQLIQSGLLHVFNSFLYKNHFHRSSMLQIYNVGFMLIWFVKLYCSCRKTTPEAKTNIHIDLTVIPPVSMFICKH